MRSNVPLKPRWVNRQYGEFEVKTIKKHQHNLQINSKTYTRQKPEYTFLPDV